MSYDLRISACSGWNQCSNNSVRLIFVFHQYLFYKSPSYIPFNNRVLVVFAGASTNIKREVSMEEV